MRSVPAVGRAAGHRCVPSRPQPLPRPRLTCAHLGHGPDGCQDAAHCRRGEHGSRDDPRQHPLPYEPCDGRERVLGERVLGEGVWGKMLGEGAGGGAEGECWVAGWLLGASPAPVRWAGGPGVPDARQAPVCSRRSSLDSLPGQAFPDPQLSVPRPWLLCLKPAPPVRVSLPHVHTRKNLLHHV